MRILILGGLGLYVAGCLVVNLGLLALFVWAVVKLVKKFTNK
jgi:hypothetical protein